MMYKPYETTFRNQTLTIREKLANLSFTYLLLIITLAAIGVIILYSAANGNWQPWAVNQLVRFTIGFGLMLFLALIDIRWLMRYARYFHTSSLQTIESTKGIIPPLLMALFPAALIILQPDLGTALMLLFTTGAIFFAVGVQVWKFAVVFIGGLVSMPIVVLNFLILAYSYSFALKSTSYFGKLVAIGLATNYFMYVFINISMVLGLIPVVGIPLPLISYGGTVMLSIMASFGIILSVHINRNVQIGKD